MKFKSNTVTVGGQTIFYLQKGYQQKGTIVLLHGFPGNHQGLVGLANGIGEGYRLIVVDLPACGKTSSLKGVHLLENYAKWLDGFLNVLDINQVIVIGHSFGSRVALVFADRYPKRVQKLVLITPVVGLYGTIARLASLKGHIAKMLPKYMQKKWLTNGLYQYAVKKIIFKSASHKRRQKITDLNILESKNIDVKATIEIFEEFYRVDLTPLGHRVKAKTLIVAGDKDEVATIASLQLLAGAMPLAELKIMKGAGHLVPLEKPRTTANIIKNWLQNI